MTKQAITNRFLLQSAQKQQINTNLTKTYSAMKKPNLPATPTNKMIAVNDKKVSRTIDCAKSIKRRSINFLNNVIKCFMNKIRYKVSTFIGLFYIFFKKNEPKTPSTNNASGSSASTRIPIFSNTVKQCPQTDVKKLSPKKCKFQTYFF
jgi:hypothetical protein